MRIYFCPHCGEKFPAKANHCSHCGFEPHGSDPYRGASAIGAGGIGWSDRIQAPQFAKYQKSRRKIIMIWAFALAILIPALILIFDRSDGEGENLFVVLVIGGMFLLIGLYSALSTRHKGKGWDGVVEDKKVFEKKRRVSDNDGNSHMEHYLEYIVYVRRTNGRIEELKYTNDATVFDYYAIGDFLHKHANRNLRTIEKYDKSKDEIIFCAACGGMSDIRADYCLQCGCPLLKGQ